MSDEIDEKPARSLTEEKLEALRAKYGRIAHCRGADDSWEVVLRKPTLGEVRKLRSDLHNDTTAPMAIEFFVRATAVYPEKREEVDALINEWPGLPDGCQKQIQKLTGMSVEASGK